MNGHKSLAYILFIISLMLLGSAAGAFADSDVCSSGCAYTTITDALNAAADGDVISVGPGTYPERLVITKNVTLRGNDSTIQPTVAPTPGVYDIEIKANGTIIQNFTLDFNGADDTRSGNGIVVSDLNQPPVADVKILNNTIYTGDANTAIQTGKNADISGLVIAENIFYADDTGMGEGIYINPFQGSGKVTIENNSFYGNIYSAISIESGNVEAMSNVIFSNSTQSINGVRVLDINTSESLAYPNSYGSIVIFDNRIQNVTYGISVGTGSDDGSSLTVNAERNIIANNTIGIWARNGANITAHFNDILDNSDYGANVTGNSDFNATMNFWGSTDGPGGAGAGSGNNVTATIAYIPYMASSFSATPSTPTVAITDNSGYTNDVTPALTLTAGAIVPDLMAFSCDDVAYSADIAWATSYSAFDVKSGAGCSVGDGNKAIYVRVSDYAGNVQSVAGFDSTILDTVIPSLNASTFTNAANGFFSPANQDGIFDVVVIALNASETIENWVSLIIYNSTVQTIDNRIKSYFPTADDTDDLIQPWNGKNTGDTFVEDAGYTLKVKMQDYAGNENETIVENLFMTVDNTPPSGSFISPASGANLTGIAVLNASLSDSGAGMLDARFNISNAAGAYRYNAANSSDYWYNSTFDTSAIPDGNYNATIFARDAAYNVNSTVFVPITIDNTNASAQFVTLNDGDNVTGTISINISAGDDTSGVRSVAVRNGTAWMPASMHAGDIHNGFWNITFDTASVADGPLDITLNVTDFAGNSNTSKSITIHIDNTLPKASFLSPANGDNITGTAILKVNAREAANEAGVSSVSIKNGTANWIPMALLEGNAKNGNWTLSFATKSAPDGLLRLTINATDAVGQSNASEFIDVMVDNSAPNVPGITSPAALANISGQFVLNATVDDTFTAVDLVFFNITNSLGGPVAFIQAENLNDNFYSASYDSALQADGQYDLWVFANDTVGNVNQSETVAVNFDNTKPNATINLPPNAENISGIYTFNATARDGLSGIDAAYFNVTNGTGFIVINTELLDSFYVNTSFDTSLLEDGSHDVTLYALDNAGNLNNTATVAFTSDNTQPLITNPRNATADGIINNNDTVILNATITDATLAVDAVWVEANFTGAYANYTIPLNPDNSANFTIPASALSNQEVVGWRYYANDTLGNLAQSQLFSFLVENREPQFNASNPFPSVDWQESSAGPTFSLAGHFSDPDGDALAYDSLVEESQSGLLFISINNNAKTASLNSAFGQSGTGNATFRATDGISAPVAGNKIAITVTPLTNHNPSLSLPPGFSPSNLNFSEDFSLTVTLQCNPNDPDQECLNFGVDADVPFTENLSVDVNSTTGMATFTAADNWHGSANVQLEAFDNATPLRGKGTILVFVNVTSVNDAPFINFSAGTWNQSADEDSAAQTIDMGIFENDADSEDTDANLTWSLSGVNASLLAASLNQSTDILTFTPLANQHGVNTLELSLNDSHHAVTSAQLAITIASVNDLPVINATIGPFGLSDTGVATFDLAGKANDDNDSATAQLTWDVLTWNATLFNFAGTGSGQSIFFNPKTLAQPTSATDVVTLIVKDAEGGNATVLASVTINPFNNAPSQVTLISPANGATLTSVSRTATLIWQASMDPENEQITYYVFFGNDSSPQLNATTQAANLTTPVLADNTTYYWRAIAGDGTNNATASSTFSFTTDFNNAPQLVSAEPSQESFTITENASITLNASLFDADGDAMSYNFSIDGITALSGTTPDNNETVSYTYGPGFNDSGAHLINLTFADANNNAGTAKGWAVTVSGTNRAPLLTATIPSLSWPEDTVNSSLNLSHYFSDPDGDALTFTSSTIANITAAISGSGIVTLTPAANFNGAKAINFTASDASLTATSNQVTLTVLPVNDAPAITTNGPFTISEGIPFSAIIAASDADGDILTYSDNTTLFAINPANGNITFTPGNDFVGHHDANITVHDPSGLSDSRVYRFTITNSNNAPVLAAIGAVQATEDALLRFNITASDADLDINGETLSYSTGNGRFAIAKLNNTLATVSFTPDNNDVGSMHVNFTVTDTAGLSDTKTVIIQVANTNDAPQITGRSPASGTAVLATSGASATRQFSLNFTDPDAGDSGQIVTWRIDGASVQATTSTSYTASGSGLSVGTHVLNATVGDVGFSDSASWTLTVSDTPVSSLYGGSIFGFSAGQLASATGINIQRSGRGTIDFGGQTMDITGVIDIDNNIVIDIGIIAINSGTYPSLNRPAAITLAGLSPTADTNIYFATDFNQRNGALCPDTRCQNVSWDPITGTLSFTVTGFSTYYINTGSSVTPPLDITKVRVTSDGTERKLKPGEAFSVEVDFENNAGVDLEDVTLRVYFEDESGNELEDDDGDDLEDDAEFDLDSGDDEGDVDDSDREFSFTAPFDVDDGDEYFVVVEIEGTAADNGTLTFKDIDRSRDIEFERDSHELVFYRSSLTPNILQCGRTTTANIGVRNIGEDTEDVILRVSIPDLEMARFDSFELEEDADDNEVAKAFSFTIGDDVVPGTYPVIIEAEYGNDKEAEAFSLEVQSCETLSSQQDKAPPVRIPEVSIPQLPARPVSQQPTEQATPDKQIAMTFDENPIAITLIAVGLILWLGLVTFVMGAAIILVRRGR